MLTGDIRSKIDALWMPSGPAAFSIPSKSSSRSVAELAAHFATLPLRAFCGDVGSSAFRRRGARKEERMRIFHPLETAHVPPAEAGTPNCAFRREL